MDAPDRGALMLVRFCAAALIAWSVLDLSLDLVTATAHHAQVRLTSCVIESIPALAGVVGLIQAKRLAHWISDKLE
ncbi:MAG: hypothetical protein KGR98_11550 [Verrucomicrobia bacterium]|nr:hypothetical protein [Verrucomicrobiota bacterium]MDE3100416.1 hypothetical protein [Verrucomicrobiota bacterium]